MEKKILEGELEELQFEILRMSALVEKAIYDSTKALFEDQVDLAKQVIAIDDNIDKLNIEVQDKCLRLLALRQPVAADLRVIQTHLQVAMDLERMGDYSENIARSALRLHGKRSITKLIFLPLIADLVRKMVHDIITSYILADVNMAMDCSVLDEDIDYLYKQSFDALLEMIKNDPEQTFMAIQLLFAGSYLERIADHATNISESVVYMVTGKRSNLNE